MIRKELLLLLIILFQFNFIFGGVNNSNEQYKSLNKLTNEKLYIHLKVASKSYKGQWDLDVLIPIKIFYERKGNSIKFLGDALNDKDNFHSEVRVIIAETLGEMKDKKAIIFLENALPSSEPRVRSQIKESLGMLAGGSKILEMINNADNFEEKFQALRAINKSNISSSYAIYHKLMEIAFNIDEHWELRRTALIYLGKKFVISSKSVNKKILELLDNEKELDFIKAFAISTLGNLKDSKNINTIVSTIDKSNSPFVWRACIGALATIGNEDCDLEVRGFEVKAEDNFFIDNKQKRLDQYYSGDNYPDLKKLNISKNDKSSNNSRIVQSSDPNSKLGINSSNVYDAYSTLFRKYYKSRKESIKRFNKMIEKRRKSKFDKEE